MPNSTPRLFLTRRVAFSSGHRYWVDRMSEEENRSLFGKYASRFNHGHNYVLDVSVQGDIDPAIGMVVNIKAIDDVVQTRVVDRLDFRSLNDEVPELAGKIPCLENLMAFIWADLAKPGVLPAACHLSALRLEETPDLYGELDMKTTTLTRVYEFAASHRLHIAEMSDKENVELFGKCNNPAGHGHNYLLEVTVSGEPDPLTGMIVDLCKVDERVNELVVDRYDHKNLDVDLPEFKGRPTTSELVANEIFTRLEGNLPAKLERVRLMETARSIFEVRAS